MISLRRFLLVSLIGAIALLWAIAGFLSFQDARKEMNALFDAQLAESAKVLLTQAGHEIHEREEEGDEEKSSERFEHPYGQKLYFQIRDREGRLLLRSAPEVPNEPLSSVSSGFETRTLEGEPYRVFSLWNRKHRLQIQVAQRLKLRERFSKEVAFHIILPLLLALPFLALWILWSINRAFKPLSHAARQVSSRDPDHLEALTLPDCPSEALPLIQEINSLLGRLKNALENERRFTSDASHELRTPLAALKTQAEVARAAQSEPERNHALKQIAQAVDRVSHLVSQLLTLARLDPQATLERKDRVNLRSIASDVLQELAPQAMSKRIELSLAETGGEISGNPTMLAVLTRNLVDNAIRYTPEGGEVRVRVDSNSGGVTLEVEDTGAGIPRDLQTRIFDRFYRAPGARSEGSGLGLSIVRKIAEIHSARIELSDPPGLRVSVLFSNPIRSSEDRA